MSLFGWPENELRWKSLLAEQVRLNGRLFFRLAQKILRNEKDAEDAVQQAFLDASTARHDLKDPGALRAWLARTVTNESLQMRRRRKTEQRVLERQGGAARAMTDGRAEEQADLRERILEAIDRLSDTPRLVFVLRVVDGMSGNQVKELLGCSEGEVSRQLNTAREKLRPLLSDWWVSQGDVERESNVL